ATDRRFPVLGDRESRERVLDRTVEQEALAIRRHRPAIDAPSVCRQLGMEQGDGFARPELRTRHHRHGEEIAARALVQDLAAALGPMRRYSAGGRYPPLSDSIGERAHVDLAPPGLFRAVGEPA